MKNANPILLFGTEANIKEEQIFKLLDAIASLPRNVASF